MDPIAKTVADVAKRKNWTVLDDGRRVQVPLRDGREQIVRIETYTHGGMEIARFWTAIGPLEEVRGERPIAALRLNFSLPHGALAAHDGLLVLVRSQLVADADPGEVENAIGFLAEQGDAYERLIFRTDAH
ncbi:MAG: hypothetical protein JXP34_14655 [Planctomycetes bacterium]|nr:hypothetical protein [Planctomycetota bacterium]